MCSADIFLGLLAILFPPLPVWVKCGICSADSIINILLCMLAYLPGLLHSWYIIAKFPEEYDYQQLPQERESGRVTYVVVTGDQGHHQQRPQPQAQPKPQRQPDMNYGTANPGENASQSSTTAQAGSSTGDHGPAPPTYAEAVRGDHKVQSQD
ncbi:hypothetical protein BX600DRAFT_504951 [Xylariales sp. PMI_506]|nr:hypothetical protein BX600DRAFT_504951 [Xylariales sp. PMI_506]